MLAIVLTMSVVQLLAAQRVLISPQVVKFNGIKGTCPPQYIRDLIRQNLSQTVRNIIEVSAHIPHCGVGLWTRVAYLNMSDPVQQCPSSWRLYSANGVRACGRPSQGCHSQSYTVQQRYNKVCGQIIGYQFGSTDAFHPTTIGNNQIDQTYVDGVSVTYGTPRKHIWTFAAGISETNAHPQFSCPCASIAGTPQPPSYVGNNYFCESGNPLNTFEVTGNLRYTDDPLWDGRGCDSEGQCCSNANPPWFSVDLPDETNEPIEIRICGFENIDNDDTPIEILDLYVQ